MEKFIHVLTCLIIWFACWMMIAVFLMVANNAVNDIQMSLYDSLFDMFTVVMQFVIGWMPVILFINYKKLIRID